MERLPISQLAWSKVFLLTLVAFGAPACLGPSAPPDESGSRGRTDDPEPIHIDRTNPVPDDVRQGAPAGPYRWQNAVIKGGGFVTGIVFSQAAPNLVYARTDVGGAYRYDITLEQWIPITDFIGQEDINLAGIESIAADASEPRRVYLAAGMYVTAGSGWILRSEDFGKTWSRHAIGVPMGGNVDGRSMGERLAIDPNRPEKLYFGSRTQGLWESTDSAASWNRVASFPATGDADMGLSFVLFDGRSERTASAATSTVYVGVATVTGSALYRTRDGGESWHTVPGQPSGLMPHHAALDSEGVLYLAYNDGPGPNDIDVGAIYALDTKNEQWTDVSPRRDAGFGGVTVDARRPGTVMASTIALWAPDEIYRSTDGGRTWSALGGRSRRDDAGARWLYFGGTNLTATGWMGDIEIDPFHSHRALHVTGQGIWWSDDITNTDTRHTANWSFHNDGLEETVALDLVSPPSGPPLISAVGDIAGFRHDDLTLSPPNGMFADPLFGNTNGLDFAELAPHIVARVGRRERAPRGAYSTDGGTTWTPFGSDPPGQGEGSIAVSADGETFVWSPLNGAVSFSRDQGETWTASEGISGTARVAADRVNPELFYAASRSGFFVSEDGGASFIAMHTTMGRGARPRPVFGIEGEVWLLEWNALQRSSDAGRTFTPITGVSSPLAVGFGRAAPDADYPAVYVSGQVGGTYGIFRSDDAGASFTRIDDEHRRFGWVNHITGDQRQYGRVYLGTGGRGVLYGDPVEEIESGN